MSHHHHHGHGQPAPEPVPQKADQIWWRILLAIAVTIVIIIAAPLLCHKPKRIALPAVIVTEAPVVKQQDQVQAAAPEPAPVLHEETPALQETAPSAHEDVPVVQDAPSELRASVDLPPDLPPVFVAGPKPIKLFRHYARHHRFVTDMESTCEPMCLFFKATARAAGLIE